MRICFFLKELLQQRHHSFLLGQNGNAVWMTPS